MARCPDKLWYIESYKDKHSREATGTCGYRHCVYPAELFRLLPQQSNGEIRWNLFGLQLAFNRLAALDKNRSCAGSCLLHCMTEWTSDTQSVS
jgi:hypothetical protein